MIGVIVAAVVVAVVGGSILLARFGRHPEQTATHDERTAESTSDRLYGGADRPAGPDADDLVAPGGRTEPDSGIRAPHDVDPES